MPKRKGGENFRKKTNRSKKTEVIKRYRSRRGKGKRQMPEIGKGGGPEGEKRESRNRGREKKGMSSCSRQKKKLESLF